LKTLIGDIDVLGETPGASFEQLMSNSVEHELYGHKVAVASLEDLIAMKLVANRPKDRMHVLELEALRATHRADANSEDSA
jgi:hypothetical protein